MSKPSTEDNVRAVLRDILQIGDRADNLAAESILLGGIPEFDSMAVVGVITAIEEEFDIFIEDDEISAEDFETFGSLCVFIDRQTK